MSKDWRYLAEYAADGGRRNRLRKVFRTRPLQPAGDEDEIFARTGWRPTKGLVPHRFGRGDHDLVDISEAQADGLVAELRSRWQQALDEGVAEVVRTFEANDLRERADQVADAHSRLRTEPAAELRLHELVTDPLGPRTIHPKDEEARIRFNRARAAVARLTRPNED